GQRIGQRGHIHRLGGLNLGRRAAAHEQGMAAPLDDDLLPGCTAPSSTSVEASANAAVEGFIWSTKGQAAAVRPTAPTAPDATYRKSRRVPASLIVAATGSTLLGNLERNVELLPRTSADAVLTQRRGQYHFWAPPPFVRWASKIESRFSRVLRHDDAENALFCRHLSK